MRLPTLALLAVLAAPLAHAQEDGAAGDTLRAADGWRSSLTATLAGNQAAYANWQEGGVDALAVTASAEGTFGRVVGRVLVSQGARLAFGVLRQDTLDFPQGGGPRPLRRERASWPRTTRSARTPRSRRGPSSRPGSTTTPTRRPTPRSSSCRAGS